MRRSSNVHRIRSALFERTVDAILIFYQVTSMQINVIILALRGLTREVSQSWPLSNCEQ